MDATVFGGKTDRRELRYLASVAGRGLMGRFRDAGMDVVNGEIATVRQVFQSMTVDGGRPIDKCQQRWIGAKMHYRADDGQVGLPLRTNCADHIGALVTGQTVDKGGALPLRQGIQIRLVQLHVDWLRYGWHRVGRLSLSARDRGKDVRCDAAGRIIKSPLIIIREMACLLM